MKYLILLNRKFPYQSGEAFLENEMATASNFFDKIIIFPANALSKDQPTRQIKEKNISVQKLNIKNFKLEKIKYLLLAPKYMSKGTGKKLTEKLQDGYFLAATQKQAKAIKKYLGKINFKPNDEIYLYSYWFYINAEVACTLKKYFKQKGVKVHVFSRAHRFDIYSEKRRFKYLPMREQLLEEIDSVYACSENGAGYLRSKYPKFKNKIRVSLLGTYDHGFKTKTSSKFFCIVSCSRLGKEKRVDRIIDGLKIIGENDFKIKWTHIGGGKTLPELEARCIEELPKNITTKFLGVVKNAKVYDYYLKNDVDLFINVSNSEGLPVSIMEAISFGIPVVATDVGGTSEIVVNGKNGFLLRADFSDEELADAIKKVMKTPGSERQKLRTQARKIWERNFQAIENYKTFYNAVMEHE